jgi:hypothetical protein
MHDDGLATDTNTTNTNNNTPNKLVNRIINYVFYAHTHISQSIL